MHGQKNTKLGKSCRRWRVINLNTNTRKIRLAMYVCIISITLSFMEVRVVFVVYKVT